MVFDFSFTVPVILTDPFVSTRQIVYRFTISPGRLDIHADNPFTSLVIFHFKRKKTGIVLIGLDTEIDLKRFIRVHPTDLLHPVVESDVRFFRLKSLVCFSPVTGSKRSHVQV
ncbi:MAG: hypothetical protein QUS12_05005 [Methanosarcina sp.]|nr:hypothetical protein [Methanosarcina sp.]